MTDDEIVFVGGAARRLNVSEARARQIMDEGRLGPVQRGLFGYRFVTRAALEAYARERERREKARTGSR